MTAALLTIGTELTRGELRDKNGGDLAEKLTDMGFLVTEICSVDDDDARIVATILRLSTLHDVVVCTGGLGPTTDDRTSACAAQALGVRLVRDETAYRELASKLSERGRALTSSNEKQADFPDGAKVLNNPRGTAPGFEITISKCHFFFMPGVPAEMSFMFEREVMPRLARPEAQVVCRRLRTYGLPESEVNDRLRGLEETYEVTIGYRATNSEIEVKVLATAAPGEDLEACSSRARAAKDEVRARLGSAVYAEGVSSLSQTVGGLLRAQGKTLGLCESCTGGLLGHMITQEPGASDYFEGGFATYSDSAKVKLASVDPQTLRDHGAVSQLVATQMAEGARTALGVDIALSITGIAGPGGGSVEKPVGLVHMAVSTIDGTTSFRHVFRGTRGEIQQRAAIHALWLIRTSLLSHEPMARD